MTRTNLSMAALSVLCLSAAAPPRWRSMTDFSESPGTSGSIDGNLFKFGSVHDGTGIYAGASGLPESGFSDKASASGGSIYTEHGSGHLGSVSPVRSAGKKVGHKKTLVDGIDSSLLRSATVAAMKVHRAGVPARR